MAIKRIPWASDWQGESTYKVEMNGIITLQKAKIPETVILGTHQNSEIDGVHL